MKKRIQFLWSDDVKNVVINDFEKCKPNRGR